MKMLMQQKITVPARGAVEYLELKIEMESLREMNRKFARKLAGFHLSCNSDWLAGEVLSKSDASFQTYSDTFRRVLWDGALEFRVDSEERLQPKDWLNVVRVEMNQLHQG